MKSEIEIKGDTLKLTRIFDAPRERVFAAWTKPEFLERWCACEQSTRVEFQMDFRVGGAFTETMVINGTDEFKVTGVYEEIVEPERIVYHVDLGFASTRVTLEFIAQGDRTKLVLTQVGFPDEKFAQLVSQGTAESFDKLDELLSENAASSAAG